jgi:5-methylcytosine-specific restriction endonuclease McrA
LRYQGPDFGAEFLNDAQWHRVCGRLTRIILSPYLKGMTKLPVFGTCHICGVHGKLSFEHVPPEAAFNNRPILHIAFENFRRSKNLDELAGGVTKQRGAGTYTLCEKCNSATGSWYGGAYADWAHQAMRFVIETGGRPSLMYPFNLFPLRVLKQVVCMFFSVNGPLFQKHQPDLVRFVLNRQSRMFPANARVYAIYAVSDRSRAAGITGLARGLDGTNPSLHVFSEVTFPPFGFVMTLDDSPPPVAGLCEISSFSHFEYRDWRAAISMKLCAMPIYTAFPGDYRTRDQTLTDSLRDLERAAGCNSRKS